MALHNVGGPLSNLLKALKEKTEVPGERDNSASGLPLDPSCNIMSSLVSSLPACPADFGLASLQDHMSQFLKMSFSLTHPSLIAPVENGD